MSLSTAIHAHPPAFIFAVKKGKNLARTAFQNDHEKRGCCTKGARERVTAVIKEAATQLRAYSRRRGSALSVIAPIWRGAISLRRLGRAHGFAFAAPVDRSFDGNQNFASDLHLARASTRVPHLIELAPAQPVSLTKFRNGERYGRWAALPRWRMFTGHRFLPGPHGQAGMIPRHFISLWGLSWGRDGGQQAPRASYRFVCAPPSRAPRPRSE
jgi:hypothetical protein